MLHSLSLPIRSCLGCTSLLTGLLSLRSLLRRMFFLPYAYFMVAFCFFCFCFCSCFSFLIFLFLFVCFLFCVPPWRQCPLLATSLSGACHYLTNRFQMKAPVAPSRSLQEGSMKPPWVWLKPSRSLREGFSKASRRLQRPRRLHEALVKTSRTLRGGATASPLRECFMKAP